MLLAAGAGRRLGAPKALVVGGDGVPWLTARAGALVDGGCSPVLVVLGAAADQARTLLPDDAVPVLAPAWQEGMGASLRAGLTACAELEPTPAAALVALVDTPGLTSEVVRRLVGRTQPSVLAQAVYGGRRGHPVLIGRHHWDGVRAAAAGDRGARDYLARHDVQRVECGDVGEGSDVDTPEQATRLGASW